VRSSFNEEEGTWVVEEDPSMEEVTVSGVAADLNQAKLTLVRVPDRPGIAAHVFGPIAAAGIVVDMIIQNASADGTTDLTFTAPRDDYEKAKKVLEAVARDVGAETVAPRPASRRCRSSASACARTPASPRACSTYSRRPASTSR
jgi:aspartate kinase